MFTGWASKKIKMPAALGVRNCEELRANDVGRLTFVDVGRRREASESDPAATPSLSSRRGCVYTVFSLL